MSKTALIVIAEGTEEIEAITPGDVLNRAGVHITYAGVGSIAPRGGHAVPLRADMFVEDVGSILFDALVIPGGGKGSENMSRSAVLSDLIMRHWTAGKIIAAICAAPAVVLGPLGILANRHATCYPGLDRRFPKDVKDCTASVCVDGHLVTSRGPGTALEFSLRLAELMCGAQTAIKVGQSMLVGNM
jgi:4-methyl-5(b-hydroxyethyl)-thiazole monophosphate biosynthesis